MTGLGNRVVPSLLARDMGETRRFYVDGLGFRVTGSYPDEETPAWLELTRDGVSLQFYAEPPVGTPDRPTFSGTLYLYPADVRALAEELRDRVPFSWGPEVMDYGMREFAVQDPNGYYIAFTEPA